MVAIGFTTRMMLAREMPKVRASALIDSPAWSSLRAVRQLYWSGAQGLALRLRARQARLDALDQQVTISATTMPPLCADLCNKAHLTFLHAHK
jgi:hypothetical protein